MKRAPCGDRGSSGRSRGPCKTGQRAARHHTPRSGTGRSPPTARRNARSDRALARRSGAARDRPCARARRARPEENRERPGAGRTSPGHDERRCDSLRGRAQKPARDRTTQATYQKQIRRISAFPGRPPWRAPPAARRRRGGASGVRRGRRGEGLSRATRARERGQPTANLSPARGVRDSQRASTPCPNPSPPPSPLRGEGAGTRSRAS